MSIAPPERWQRIERVFAEALDRPAPERAAYVESACTDDPALGAELDRLLDAHDRAGRFLDELDPERSAALLEAVGEEGEPGQTIGRYRVVRRLGRGGMGVVYLAHDARLDRPVALKLLPPYLSADEQAKRRLMEEAKAASALDHPNIATIYEIDETEDGRLFLAMAYYEGETLRERIARGPLPIDEAVGVGLQVASALAAAHARGIVHRDIKPANVILTAEGVAKVVDFGVAKVTGSTLTQPGQTPGTVAYMSPEQTRGEAVDPRTDLWSLGTVLYEMLTGERPFRGEGEAVLIHAIRHDDPKPLLRQRPEIPVALVQIVARCLEKDPDARYNRAEELVAELQATNAGAALPVTPTMRRRHRGSRERHPGLLGTALRRRARRTAPAVTPIARLGSHAMVITGITVAVAVLAFLAWATLRSPPPHLTVSNVRQITRAPEPELDPVLSPNGQEVAYAAGWGNQLELFVQDLRGSRAFPLTRDVPGWQYGPRWTPDGASIVFHSVGRSVGWPAWSGDQARSSIIPRLGGPATLFLDGRVWDLIGDAIVYTTPRNLLVRDSLGAAPRVLVTSLMLHSARFSPDGRRVAFVEGGGVPTSVWAIGDVGPSQIRIVPTAGGDVVPVTTDLHTNTSPAWLDGRHLLFVSNRDGPRDIYLVRLAPDGRPSDDPLRVTTGLEPHTIGVAAGGGAVVYSRLLLRRNVWAVNIPERGSVSVSAARPVTTGNQRVENHGVSADGAWLLFDSNRRGNQDVFIKRIGAGEPRRLTRDPADDFHPDLSPDGRTVAFHSTRFGTRDIFLTDVTGGAVSRLTSDPTEEAHPAFSPDGNALAFELRGGADHTQPTVAVMTRVDSGAAWSAPRRVAAGWTPLWSPDGGQLVYETDRGVVIADLEGNERLLVPRTWEGFAWPHWAADGTIYFWGTDGSGQDGILAVSPDGGAPRRVVRLDDPRFQSAYGLSVSGNTLFMSLAEYESDIWSLDLDF